MTAAAANTTVVVTRCMGSSIHGVILRDGNVLIVQLGPDKRRLADCRFYQGLCGSSGSEDDGAVDLIREQFAPFDVKVLADRAALQVLVREHGRDGLELPSVHFL